MEGCGCTVAVRYNPEVSRDVWWMGNIVRFLPRSEMKWDINCTPAAKVGGDDVRAWSARKKQREDEAFNRCTTAGERANCDAGRFLDYYFLTNGEPDQTETPEAFVVYGVDDRMPLHQMATEIPRLHMSSGSYGDRGVCIG